MARPGTLTWAEGEIPFGPDARTLCVNDQMGYVCEEEAVREEISRGDFSTLVRMARDGEKWGSRVFNVQLMHPLLDEGDLFLPVMETLLEQTKCALAFDTRDPQLLDRALQAYPYKAMCNCVNGELANLQTFLPVIARHGGAVGTALVDEQGIPQTVAERLKVGRRIVDAVESHGISRKDLILDGVCLPLAVAPDGMMTTLETLRAFREELGVPTLLGVSNAGYMMPNPRVIDLAVFVSAVTWGLDVAMIDPMTPRLDWLGRAADLVAGRDDYAREYLHYYRSSTQAGGEKDG